MAMQGNDDARIGMQSPRHGVTAARYGLGQRDRPMTTDPCGAVEDRRRRARTLAATAVDALAAKGIAARAIGSLERSDFRADSDVDLLVDCGQDRFKDVMDACWDAFGEFPFDVVFGNGLGPGVRDAMLAEAARLIPFASVGRRADVVRRDVADLRRKAGCIEKYLADTWDAETWVGITEDHACRTVERLAMLLRRVVLDAGGDVPAGASPAEVYALASGEGVGGVRVVRPATAALLAAMDPYETDWPGKYRDAPTALANARTTAEAAEAVMSDVDAFVAARLGP